MKQIIKIDGFELTRGKDGVFDVHEIRPNKYRPFVGTVKIDPLLPNIVTCSLARIDGSVIITRSYGIGSPMIKQFFKL